MSKKKVYAVKVGLTPGLYDSWDECKAMVNGYPGAEYKGFATREEAEAYLTGQQVANNSDSAQTLKPSSGSSQNIDILENVSCYAFVDGSFNAETGVYGYGGFLFVNGERYPISGSGCDPEMASMRNVAGEVEGAIAAVKKAKDLKVKELTILYDYLGIEQWVTGDWKSKKAGTKEYAAFMCSAKNEITIKFKKVKAHTGIEGNEIADIMAKSAVGIYITKKQQELLENLI